MTYIRHFILIIFTTFASLATFAQTNGVNSPYSRYGFGILSDRSMGFNKGMGGVAMGLETARQSMQQTRLHIQP